VDGTRRIVPRINEPLARNDHCSGANRKFAKPIPARLILPALYHIILHHVSDLFEDGYLLLREEYNKEMSHTESDLQLMPIDTGRVWKTVTYSYRISNRSPSN